MPHTTIAQVHAVEQAHAIADDLHAAGFQSSAISLVFPQGQGDDLVRLVPSEHLRQEGADHRGIADFNGRVRSISSTLPRHTSRWLATGPILTILSGIRLRGTPDGLPEALAGLGVPASEARHFTAASEAGNTLIIVRTDEDVGGQLVMEVFRHHGGREIAQFSWPD